MADGFGAESAILFGVACDVTYTVFSATNSSPQTTELFSADRSRTLWKYVRLGALQTGIIIGVMAVAASTDGGMRLAAWPLAGGALVGGMMYMMYSHALAAGAGHGQVPGQGRR
jgi:hypothetical protein